MTQQCDKLLTEAMHLTAGERGDLAAKLIESLEVDEPNDVEDAWSIEIARRLEEVRNGKVKLLSWPEARALILDDADDDHT